MLDSVEKEQGLYYNYLSASSAKWCMKQASVGAMGDSFYEYLLKLWLLNRNKENLSKFDREQFKTRNKANLRMLVDVLRAINSNLVQTSQSSHLVYVGEYKSGRVEKRMDHLACFSAGLFSMTAHEVDSLDANEKSLFMNLAKNITNTCHESYIRSPTHIGPEAFHFERPETEAMALKQNEKYYILRPEVIEAYFYMWRLTKEQKYRDWAWDAVKAFEKHCRTENGYSGIRDVYNVESEKDDVQQSFFFAETLKYLFLIFSDDTVLPLDKYVLNTEAHPFLIPK